LEEVAGRIAEYKETMTYRRHTFPTQLSTSYVPLSRSPFSRWQIYFAVPFFQDLFSFPVLSQQSFAVQVSTFNSFFFCIMRTADKLGWRILVKEIHSPPHEQESGVDQGSGYRRRQGLSNDSNANSSSSL
jgi:hypothetical protein